MYINIFFFADREESFIAWISSVVKQLYFEEKEYIYKEGEIANSIFFLVNGHLGYVLPRYKNKKFKEILTGEHFGHVDFAEYVKKVERRDRGSQARTSNAASHQLSSDRKKDDFNKAAIARPVRNFTVLASSHGELLELKLDDLLIMRIEFPGIFEELF